VRTFFLGFHQLKSIFPNNEPNEIREALENANGCIETATEILLGNGTYILYVLLCLANFSKVLYTKM
jgi:hypothetical protein